MIATQMGNDGQSQSSGVANRKEEKWGENEPGRVAGVGVVVCEL